MQNILGGIDPIPTVKPDPTHYQVAGDTGFTTLWVVFVILLVASGFFSLLAWNIPVSQRVYHIISTLITITGALSYFSLATGHGTSLHCSQVRDHNDHVPDTFHDVCREIYFARYIDWAVSTPLTLLNLSLLAGIDGAHTLMAIVANVIMVLSGLFSAYGSEHTAQRWGWYAISIISYVFVIWHVAVHGPRTVKAKGTKVVKLFGSLGLFTFIVLTAYPVVWGVAVGARKATVDAEIIAYAVIDVLAKVVFGFWLLISHRSIPETNVDVGGYWAHGLSNEGRIRLGEDD